MCGIAGQVKRDAAVEPRVIERMCAAIEHRGPDARGRFFEGGIGLGIQRLRIIDLETGDQPIFNEDQSVVVVLNGEIYNFRDLRKELLRRGHEFRTRSDTEVIVHLYEEHGPDCVSLLHGMFAFALWDARAQRLVLARDRVGKKPLFYSHRGTSLSFASEMAGLLQDEEIPREIDHQAMDCFYAYQYVPAPLSAFRAIRKLPPATVLTFCRGAVRQHRYWRLDYRRKVEVTDPRELHEEILSTVEMAVARRMIADVPLGAFLSGGIDSSAIVAAMARRSSAPVKTFSIGFAHSDFNELPYARQVAQEFSTDHHEFIVEPSAIEILPKLVRHYGEPFADSSAIPSFYLAELTRRHVTVALNGDGGDEAFGGYGRYVWNSDSLVAKLGKLPHGARRPLAALARHMPAGAPQSFRWRVHRFGRLLDLTPRENYERAMSFFDRYERQKLYTPGYSGMIGESLVPSIIQAPWDRASGGALIDLMLETDVETYLPGDLLVKMDIATMAHSLEARSPLLDHQLLEMAAKLPAGLKVSGSEKKIVFREALTAWLPRSLLDRPKMGFGVPLKHWFRDELRDYAADVLLDRGTLARGYFERPYLESLLAQHRAGTMDHSSRMWALIMAELWHRQYVDAPKTLLAVGA